MSISAANQMHDGSVEVSYRLSDLYAVSMRAWRSWLRAFAIIETILVTLTLALPMFDGANLLDAVRAADWFLPGFGILLILLLLMVSPLFSYVASKLRRNPKPFRLSLSEPGVNVVNSDFQSLVSWSGIKRVVGSKERLFLFISSTMAFIVPRRVFETDAEFQGWVEFAKDRWSEAKLQKRSGGLMR